MALILTSPVIEPNGRIPKRYTADGADVSPPLQIGNIPQSAVQLALILDDPDAPRPEPWVHWVACTIPADTQTLPEGIEQDERPARMPSITQGQNTWGTVGYRGPAPPRGHGVHHYHFRIYALRSPIEVPASLTKEGLLGAMRRLILEEAELVGLYEHQ